MLLICTPLLLDLSEGVYSVYNIHMERDGSVLNIVTKWSKRDRKGRHFYSGVAKLTDLD